jgi:hypothetical protein
MGSPRDKLEVRESFPKVTFHFVKNGRFQMKLAKADSLTGVLVFLSIAFDGCPKRGFVWVFFKCNECNARNSRMNIDTVSCNLHGGILWRSASHTDFRISRQPAHCKLECIFNYDIYIYIYDFFFWFIYVHMYMYMYMYMYVYIGIYTHEYTRMYLVTSTHTHIYICILTYIHTYIYIYYYIYIFTYSYNVCVCI